MSFQQIEVGHILYLNLDLLNWGIRKHRDATRRGDGCSARWLQRQLHRKRPGTAELASASHPHQEAAHGAPATRGRTGVGGSGPDHQNGLQPGVQARAPAILPQTGGERGADGAATNGQADSRSAPGVYGPRQARSHVCGLRQL